MILDTQRRMLRPEEARSTMPNRDGVRPHLYAVILMLCVAAPAMAQDGGALYQEHCASCHNGSVDRAPQLDVLRAMTPQRILEALEFGSMVSMTHGRTTAERRALAEFASGKSLAERFTIEPAAKAMCRPGGTFSLESSQPVWNGFGQNLANTRFQPSQYRIVGRRCAATQSEVGLWPSR